MARSKKAPKPTPTPKKAASRAVPKKSAAKKRPVPGAAKLLVPPRADPKAPRYWLMKSEPDVYSIDDLARDRTTSWEGVRNYTARNFMRDEMALGDRVLFYHSNAEPSGIAGVGEIVGLAEPDPTQFDPKSPYFDPDAKRAEPRWLMVRVGFAEKLRRVVPLDELKKDRALTGMLLLAKGQRLSVQPVTEAHYARVVTLA
jgi:predicted RNA-binding protein with PUA-like domain